VFFGFGLFVEEVALFHGPSSALPAS